jgi:hypothetical protein
MALGDAIDPRASASAARVPFIFQLPTIYGLSAMQSFPQNYVRPGLPTRGRLSRATQERKGLAPVIL